MDETDILKPKSGGFLGIIITEAVVTAVILLSVIAVKYFFKGTYPVSYTHLTLPTSLVV